MVGWIKSLGKDSVVYGIGYGVSRFLQIIILPIIAQALSLSEFGYYSNYVIFSSFTGGLLILGLDSAVTRFLFESEDIKYHRQLFSSAFYFILSLAIVTITAFGFFPAWLLRTLEIPPGYGSALAYVLLCVPATAMNGFLLSWFKWKREKVHFLLNSGGSVVLLLLPLVLVSEVSFLYIFQTILFSQLTIALLSVFLARKYLRLTLHWPILFMLLKYAFPWMLVFLFGASRTYLDRIFLTRYLDANTYGLYNFSVRIATLLSVVLTAFDMSFGPLAFSIWNKEGAAGFFARLQTIYIFLISAIACAICIASPIIIQLLGGSKFEGAAKVLPLLLFAAIPLSLINFSNLGTSYAKKSFLSTASLFAGFAAVLLLNIFLTHRYLEYGAAAASLIGHIVIIIAGYLFSRKYYQIPFSFGKDAFIFVFFFLLSVIAVFFPFQVQTHYNVILQFTIFLLIFVSFLTLLFPQEYRKAAVFIKNLRFFAPGQPR